jgi:hypothetical protein
VHSGTRLQQQCRPVHAQVDVVLLLLSAAARETVKWVLHGRAVKGDRWHWVLPCTGLGVVLDELWWLPFTMHSEHHTCSPVRRCCGCVFTWPLSHMAAAYAASAVAASTMPAVCGGPVQPMVSCMLQAAFLHW